MLVLDSKVGMMRIIKISLVSLGVIGGIFSFSPGFSSSIANFGATVSADSTLIGSSSSVVSAAPEFALLRDQNILIREFQDRILNTVYWALGGVFAMALLLSGVNWWSSFRMYERDKQRLIDDFDAKLKAYESQSRVRDHVGKKRLVDALTEKLEAHAVQSADELSSARQEFAALRNEVVTSLESRLESQLDRFSHDVLSTRQEISALRAELVAKFKDLEAPIDGLTRRTEALEKSLAYANAEMRHIEEFVWEIKGVWGNVLITQSQGISDAARAEAPYLIQGALMRMKATCERMLRDSIGLAEGAVEVIQKHLSSAEEISPQEVSEVLEILARVDIIE